MPKQVTMEQLVCKHETCVNLKFYVGQGMAKRCTACGVVLVDRYRGPQPVNIPGTKIRMSKKERRAANKSKKEQSQ